MKKIKLSIIFVCISFFFGISGVSAMSGSNYNEILDLGTFLQVYTQSTTKDLDAAYKNVVLTYPNVEKGTMLYDSLQRALYIGLLPNYYVPLDFDYIPSQREISLLLEKYLSVSIPFTTGDVVDLNWTLGRINQTLALKKVDQNVILEQISTTLKKKSLYIDDIPDYKKYTTVSGFLADFPDKYVQYFDTMEAENFDKVIHGSIVGIGVYIGKTDEGVAVSDVLENSPAQQVGIVPGDRFVSIDGEKLSLDTTVAQIASLLRGKVGTIVHIQMQRNAKILDFFVQRKPISVPVIAGDTFLQGICYGRLSMFTIGIFDQFISLVKQFDDYNCSSYIFDLRGNPGGSLGDVQKILGYFVPSHTPVFAVDTAAERSYLDSTFTKSFEAYQNYFSNKNIVVLVDNTTASAAEIFASTIKSYLPKAKIMGKKTYGKGTIQQLSSFFNGGMLKYTIARWLVGKSYVSIDGVGIIPDFEIEDNPTTPKDEALEAGIKYLLGLLLLQKK